MHEWVRATYRTRQQRLVPDAGGAGLILGPGKSGRNELLSFAGNLGTMKLDDGDKPLSAETSQTRDPASQPIM